MEPRRPFSEEILPKIGAHGLSENFPRPSPTESNKKGHRDAFSLFSNDQIETLRELGPKFGVAVNVVAKEGENYTYATEKGDYKDVVGRGLSYIRLTSLKSDLTDFWREVNVKSMPPHKRVV